MKPSSLPLRFLPLLLLVVLSLPQEVLACYRCGILHNELEPCPALAPKKFDADDWGPKASPQVSSPWLQQQRSQQQGQAIGSLLLNSFNTMQEQNRAAEERRERQRREEELERREERMLEAERLRNRSVPQQPQQPPPAKQPAPPPATPPPKEEPYVAPQLGAMLTEQQAWEAKLRETQDKIAQNTKDLNRIKDGWAKSKDAQADAMKANEDGADYSLLAQISGLGNVVNGAILTVSSVLPEHYRKAVKTGLSAGAAAATISELLNAKDNAGGVVELAKGTTSFVKTVDNLNELGAIDAGQEDYVSTQKGWISKMDTGTKTLVTINKIRNGDYDGAAWEAGKLLLGGYDTSERMIDLIDGTGQTKKGGGQIVEMQDEKDKIAARDQAQKQNFSDTNDRMAAALRKKENEHQLLLEEMKSLNEQAPKTTNAPVTKP